MAGLETVYAIHNFEAENDDEIAFSVGEPIIVLEKDDGYNDGWWQGRNIRGDVGLFPVNYTSCESQNHPVTTLEAKIDALQQDLSKMKPVISAESEPSTQLPTPSSSASTRQSRDHPVRSDSVSSFTSIQSHSVPVRPVTIAPPLSSKNMHKALSSVLALSGLRGTPPEDWDVDQVALWLQAMGFASVADHFKAQEITGDILLQLTLESLKELDINTFGKRFKIHSAILALREEIMLNSQSTEHTVEHTASTNRSQPTHIESKPEELPDQHYLPEAQSRQRHTESGTHHSFLQQEHNHELIDSFHSNDLGRSPTRQYSKRKTANAEANNLPEIRHPQTRMSSEPSQGVFSPSTKPQAVLPVASRGSVDSFTQRSNLTYETPDMEGWLHKQGDKYKTWNRRWFILKGSNLFYFKSPKDVRMKGIINLRGYRIVCDETIYVGKYCFKAQHEKERTFYFYTNVESVMKAWIKVLMKATITRDFSTPVMSSSTIPTVSLDTARRMKPRPPSMILYKKDNRQSSDLQSPRSLSDDESIHNPLSPSSPRPGQLHNLKHNPNISSRQETPPITLAESKPDLQDSGFESGSHIMLGGGTSSPTPDFEPNSEEHDEEEDSNLHHLTMQSAESQGRLNRESSENAGQAYIQPMDYVEWVNQWIDNKITHPTDLRTGVGLAELLESLSNKEMHRPKAVAGSFNSIFMLDTIVAAFKFMSREGVEMNGQYTVKDILAGNEAKILTMLESIKRWSDKVHKDNKTESSGTFGQQEQAAFKDLD